ncbi:MAG: alanyl-tRNA editing protein [Lachnospiraceae bacterium]|nr:alanyl-tRNA editing protein [Lachnospiraceae bacterium]
MTVKLYDMDAYMTKFSSKVISCCKREKDDNYEVVLEATLFFPEEGGQTPDKGKLGGAEVLDVQIKKDEIIHIIDKPLKEGDTVEGEIDWQHRFYNMQQHSGEHLFSGITYKKYGYRNVGFHLSDQTATMDFDGVLTMEQAEEIEWAVNEAIVANVEVKAGYPDKEELAGMEYRSKIEIDGPVRIVEIPRYDICACCAPHVKRTGEIGMLRIQSLQNYKGGVRISFLCGFRALMESRRKSNVIGELTGLLTTGQDKLVENVSKLKIQLQSLKGQLNSASQALLEIKADAVSEDMNNVFLFERDLEASVMRSVVNKLVKKHAGICGVFGGSDKEGYTFIIGSEHEDCRETVAILKDKLNARGGGSTQMVQGSVEAGVTADEIRALLMGE